MKNKFSKTSITEKRRFLIFGVLNFMVTNLSLQIMLLYFETYLATLISQFININIGFFIYGKKVFKVKKFTFRSGFNYLLLAIFVWIVNYSCINYLFIIGFNKNIAAIIIIPLLVIISFCGQKYFVFRKLNKLF